LCYNSPVPRLERRFRPTRTMMRQLLPLTVSLLLSVGMTPLFAQDEPPPVAPPPDESIVRDLARIVDERTPTDLRGVIVSISDIHLPRHSTKRRWPPQVPLAWQAPRRPCLRLNRPL